MSIKTIHKGYGVLDVYNDCQHIGICYRNNNGDCWTGKFKHKGVEVAISGLRSMRETTDRMEAIYQLLKHA